MKHTGKSLMLVAALLASGSAAANIIDDICPYLGVDYKQLWIKGKGFWSNKIAKSFPGGTVYLGTKFTECFGAEVGYSWTMRKHHTGLISGGVLFPLPNNATVRTHTHFNSFHFDLNGYVPLDNCWELIGSLGIASMKPKVSAVVVNQGSLTNNQVNMIQSVNGKSKAVWRVGVGAQFLFTECVGARAILRWEATESLRVHGLGVGSEHHNRKAFKDAVSLAAGLFVRF